VYILCIELSVFAAVAMMKTLANDSEIIDIENCEN